MRKQRLAEWHKEHDLRILNGIDALHRLMKIAQGNSGQCRHVANFLLSCYNGGRFKMDLSDLRCLDLDIFQDCMTVLAMDYQPMREVHNYFESGNELFESLATKWGIPDHIARGWIP
jgi:hypothetical protein